MTSNTDLGGYAALSAKLAPLTEDDDLTLTPADFPAPLADHTSFGGLVIDTSFVRSIDWGGETDLPFEIVDQTFGFDALAEPEGFRRMGLWLMHFLLSGREWAGLELTHPTSRAQYFYARIRPPAPRDHKLKQAAAVSYSEYEYWPTEVWRHPFANAAMARVHRVAKPDRPLFAFGWSRDALKNQFDREKADQIILEATPEGIAAMACVLIDMAHPTLGREEINFEVPGIGFAGTQKRSIEARFWLPNSMAFYCDTLDQLVLPPTASQRQQQTEPDNSA
ncbi:hypothetical protein IV417_10135 [Alphaproteobacteria bacterium KMM 3653]|uniref:Uncharacterized protein n=1 Tax=Harenicola maris TaxID=2841044 RepID=A0AAP2G4C4_9RHOB|nr:hypothetical protein [Harenicola maris]